MACAVRLSQPSWGLYRIERPLNEELSDIAKAGGGIFITHGKRRSRSDSEIPKTYCERSFATSIASRNFLGKRP